MKRQLQVCIFLYFKQASLQLDLEIATAALDAFFYISNKKVWIRRKKVGSMQVDVWFYPHLQHFSRTKSPTSWLDRPTFCSWTEQMSKRSIYLSWSDIITKLYVWIHSPGKEKETRKHELYCRSHTGSYDELYRNKKKYTSILLLSTTHTCRPAPCTDKKSFSCIECRTLAQSCIVHTNHH